jgi:hypothetical protein
MNRKIAAAAIVIPMRASMATTFERDLASMRRLSAHATSRVAPLALSSSIDGIAAGH